MMHVCLCLYVRQFAADLYETLCYVCNSVHNQLLNFLFCKNKQYKQNYSDKNDIVLPQFFHSYIWQYRTKLKLRLAARVDYFHAPVFRVTKMLQGLPVLNGSVVATV